MERGEEGSGGERGTVWRTWVLMMAVVLRPWGHHGAAGEPNPPEVCDNGNIHGASNAGGRLDWSVCIHMSRR